MAVRVCPADDQRDLSLFLLKPDFGAFERTPIRADDVSFDRRHLRRDCRCKNERIYENKTSNDIVPKHYLDTAPISKTRKCSRCSSIKNKRSFRPVNKVCVLRSYLRHRENLVHAASAHIQ